MNSYLIGRFSSPSVVTWWNWNYFGRLWLAKTMEAIFARNSVVHMLKSKAYLRALWCQLLIEKSHQQILLNNWEENHWWLVGWNKSVIQSQFWKYCQAFLWRLSSKWVIAAHNFCNRRILFAHLVERQSCGSNIFTV